MNRREFLSTAAAVTLAPKLAQRAAAVEARYFTLGQRQGLLVRGERGCAIAVTLVNLAQDDQRHGEMVDQAEPAVEVDGGLGRRNMSALPQKRRLDDGLNIR